MGYGCTRAQNVAALNSKLWPYQKGAWQYRRPKLIKGSDNAAGGAINKNFIAHSNRVLTWS
jgi:hypothetical protein